MKVFLTFLFVFLNFLFLNGKYEKEIKNVDILNQSSREYQTNGKYNIAKEKAESALVQAKKIIYIRGIALAQNNIAHVFYSEQQYKKSISYSNLSLNNMKEIRDQLGIANNLKLLGMCYYNFDNYKKTLLFFNDALKIYKNINEKEEIADIQNMLGDANQNNGDFNKALANYLNALRGFEELKNNDGISNALVSIGSIYISIKNYKKAEEELNKAYQKSIKSKNNQIRIDALSLLGIVYKKTNNISLAHEKYRIAYKLAKKENNRYQIAAIINSIGEIQRLKKKYNRALKSYKEANDIFKELDYNSGVVTCSLNIGLVYLKKGESKQAILYFKESLSIAKSIEAKPLIRDIYEGYSDAYALLKNYKLALEYHKLFTSVKDELFTEKSSENIADMQTKYDTEKKENRIKLLSKDKDIDDIIKNSLYIVLGLLFVLAFLIYNRYRLKNKAHKALSDAHNKLELASDEISEKNEKIVSSIRYAQRIQNAILPLAEKVLKAFPENFLIFLPKDIVSGDFYWFSEVDGIRFIIVADCTGHGVPGAFMSMIGNSLLNQIINEQKITNPSIILDRLSLQVKQALKQEKGEGDTRDGMDMCFCKIEPVDKKDNDTVKLTYVGAKRPLFIVKDNELIEIKGDRKSIGGYQKKEKAPFNNNEILLTKDDVIYLTSDGFVDQHNLEEKKLGSKKFRSLLVEIASESVEQQKDILQTVLKEHKNGAEQQDDITVLGIKF